MPIYEYQDTVGPIAQTVRDAALALQVMAGEFGHRIETRLSLNVSDRKRPSGRGN